MSHVQSYHEFGLQIPDRTSHRRQLKYYITIKNWRKEVHCKVFDSIVVKPLQGIPRSLGCIELLQAIHNTAELLQTQLTKCVVGTYRRFNGWIK
jgi:hypothetical protein